MNKEKKDSGAMIGLKDLLAGSIRGIAQVAVGHPLDTVKVRLQTQSISHQQIPLLNGVDHQHSVPRFSGMLECISYTFKNEGIRGFYKGAQSPLLIAALYSAALFVAYGQSKRIFHNPDNPRFTLAEMVAISTVTGIAGGLVESPMDLLKAKMQVQYNATSTPAEYKSSMDCAVKLVRNHGFLSLYQGFAATLYRNIPGCVVYFGCYEFISDYLKRHTTDSKDLSKSSVMIAGGVAGTLFWAAIFPFDLIKSRLQTDSTNRSSRMYSSVFDCTTKIYQRGGWRAFYRGFLPCIIRAFPTNAASFLAYEFVKHKLG